MTQLDEAGERANALVAAWIIDKYRNEVGADEHLRECPDVTTEVDGHDGSYGCDTGCEYVRLEATITCPHGGSVEYEYGEFGQLSDFLDDLLKDAS